MTEEHKEKIREALKGNIPWNKNKKGVMPIPWNKDKKETRLEVIEKLRKSHLGKKQSQESIEKRRKALSGDKCYLWIDGRSKKKGYNAIYGKRYRVRKNNAEGSHIFGEWELLKKQYGFRCPSCGKKEPEIKLTEDHIIPLSKGGTDYIENIQPLCQGCNSRKHTIVIKYDNFPC